MRGKMDNFTYENNDRVTPLETYEWDNVWIQRTDDKKSPRVLYIGDSISCALRVFGNGVTKEEILIDSFGTSKAIDNAYFWDALRLFSLQEGHRDIVLFNNGLHGWHLDDEKDYPAYYERMLCKILDEFKDSKVVIVLTTAVAKEERHERVKVRNGFVKAIAGKYGLDIIDLYEISSENMDLLCDDGVHFTADGYQKISEYLVDEIRKILNK